MSYRDDTDALESRRAELARELEQVRGRIRDLDQLRDHERRVAEELASTESSLRKKRALPLLDSVQIATPCNARWEDMVGDDKVRFCRHCEKNVFNLSAMSRDDAERTIAEKEGNLCVRIYQRADGTVMTSDCPVGVRRKRVRRGALAAFGGTLLATASAAAGLAGSSSPECPTRAGNTMLEPEGSHLTESGAEPERHVMGRMVAVPPTHTAQPLMGKPVFHPPGGKAPR